ncbi:MAG: TIR domain-containing protein [Candidatus Poribacteria bacterium]|nr:TIR domain-containing protein [Candidatus Poribacteria bacterium]
MNNQHKVFVSYCHTEDQDFRERFDELFPDVYGITVLESVKMGDFDNTKLLTERICQHIRDKYLRNSTVTAVLIGANTWQQKSIDWEISASLHQTQYNTRSGLLGIMLPTYPRPPGKHYDPRTIPPRLHDNIVCGFSKLYTWNEEPYTVLSWIHYAYRWRTEILPNNSRAPFNNDLSGERWN